jgi:hypothetical protein
MELTLNRRVMADGSCGMDARPRSPVTQLPALADLPLNAAQRRHPTVAIQHRDQATTDLLDPWLAGLIGEVRSLRWLLDADGGGDAPRT